ncbi:carbon-nitrogen hydrolase family protein [Lacrimispora sp. BS-2]|uniref:Carbon-nitrogen hydrolase family protein n=1 Tax=Lacrimispora sp. BS-2 TaxID=3151850 RepID=A0AAU7PU69_9FIRM
MKVGLIQMPVTSEKEKNLSYAVQSIYECTKQGAELVILPEMFMCPYSNKNFPVYAEQAGEQTWKMLSDAAKNNCVFLIGGSMPERDGNQIFNTSFVFDPAGNEIARHRKIHLFEIDVKGGQRFKESDVFSAGNSITMLEAFGIKIGLCLCFDMRFPELSRIMTLKDAQMIVVPASFNMITGPAHWELLFRQRAVDNQLYTIGVAPARDENGPYISYGNSIVVSPWGDIVYRADEKPTTAVIDINLEVNKNIRSKLPLLSARRTDLYKVEEI